MNIEITINNKQYDCNYIKIVKNSFVNSFAHIFIKDSNLIFSELDTVKINIYDKLSFQGFVSFINTNEILCRPGNKSFYIYNYSSSFRSERFINVLKDILDTIKVDYFIDVINIEIDRISFEKKNITSILYQLSEVYKNYVGNYLIIFFDEKNRLNILDKTKYFPKEVNINRENIILSDFKYFETIPVNVNPNEKIIVANNKYIVTKYIFTFENGKGVSRIYYE